MNRQLAVSSLPLLSGAEHGEPVYTSFSESLAGALGKSLGPKSSEQSVGDIAAFRFAIQTLQHGRAQRSTAIPLIVHLQHPIPLFAARNHHCASGRCRFRILDIPLGSKTRKDLRHRPFRQWRGPRSVPCLFAKALTSTCFNPQRTRLIWL